MSLIRSALAVERNMRDRPERSELVRTNIMPNLSPAAMNITAQCVVLKRKMTESQLERLLRSRKPKVMPESPASLRVSHILSSSVEVLETLMRRDQLKRAFAKRPSLEDVRNLNVLVQENSAMACVLKRAIICAQVQRQLRLRRSLMTLQELGIVRGPLDDVAAQLEFKKKQKTLRLLLASRPSYVALVNRGLVNVGRQKPTLDTRIGELDAVMNERSDIVNLMAQNILKSDPRMRFQPEAITGMDMNLRRLSLNKKLNTRSVSRDSSAVFPTPITVSSKISAASVQLSHSIAQDSIARKMRNRRDHADLVNLNYASTAKAPTQKLQESQDLEKKMRRLTLKKQLEQRPSREEFEKSTQAHTSSWSPLSYFGW